MQTVRMSSLAEQAWHADNCKITSVSCKRSNSRADADTSTMLVGGTVTLELRKNCGVRFAWRAEQQVTYFGSTPRFAYSVDTAKAGTSQGLVFVADDGEHVPSEHYNAVIQQLASDMVTFWSSTVSHHLKSLR